MLIKRLSCFSCVLLFLVGLTGCGGKGENLLRNASLEQGSDLPDAWETWSHIPETSSFYLEEGAARHGSKYIVIHSPLENDARIIQSVRVKKEACYKVAGWVRTRDVEETGRGANINLTGMNLGTKSYFGTNEQWQYIEFYIRIKGDFSTITLSLGLGGYGGMSSGYAYFDDIQVQPVASPPADAEVHDVGEDESVNLAGSLNLWPVIRNWITGYRTSDLIMLGVMIASALFALFILLTKQESAPQNGRAALVKQPEQPEQPE